MISLARGYAGFYRNQSALQKFNLGYPILVKDISSPALSSPEGYWGKRRTEAGRLLR